ncbi:MAG: biotin--[Prevotella sp.]|nr:biotin--[acetyl-CoA-carboxylase] ligase [Prevotella sp.]
MINTKNVTIIHLDETDSTNRYLREYEGSGGEAVAVVADFQTAGRGQGKNRWESERGKNLTFSVRTSPRGVPVQQQFLLSMAIALAVRDTLATYADGMTVKWPNDIYWCDKKISGTLIETTVSGKDIRTCIFGTGININQTEFRSDAPNPVSLRQILNRDVDREAVLRGVLDKLTENLQLLEDGRAGEISCRYMEHLYRREGMFGYRDKGGDFTARIETVEPDGHLVLKTDSGEERRYAFKEVAFRI